MFYNSIPINITLDSGATTSFITEKLCKKLNIKILPNKQLARLGDGCTIIASVGEIDVSFTRQKWSVRFCAIVVKSLNTDIYAGMNFLMDNDISIRPKTGEIKIHNKHVIFQTNMVLPAPTLQSLGIPRSTTITLNVKQVLFPSLQQIWNETTVEGDLHLPPKPSNEKHHEISSLKVVLPKEFDKDEFVVVEPREDNVNKDWPPSQICQVLNGAISIPNYLNH